MLIHFLMWWDVINSLGLFLCGCLFPAVSDVLLANGLRKFRCHKLVRLTYPFFNLRLVQQFVKIVPHEREHADGRDVYLIFEPMAAAIGIGIDVEAPEGNMIVDIGGGSTEIAVISLGGIVSNNSIRTAGDDLTADIQEYMARQHNVKVSERMAERIKIAVGSALTDLGDEAPEDYIVHGPNRITALPMEVPVCYQEIAHCIDKTVAKIENAVLSALENTPPELYADIVKNGIWLAGGGALLRGLDRRLEEKINIPFHIADDPLHSVAKGAGIALKNVDRFSFLMR